MFKPIIESESLKFKEKAEIISDKLAKFANVLKLFDTGTYREAYLSAEGKEILRKLLTDPNTPIPDRIRKLYDPLIAYLHYPDADIRLLTQCAINLGILGSNEVGKSVADDILSVFKYFPLMLNVKYYLYLYKANFLDDYQWDAFSALLRILPINSILLDLSYLDSSRRNQLLSSLALNQSSITELNIQGITDPLYYDDEFLKTLLRCVNNLDLERLSLETGEFSPIRTDENIKVVKQLCDFINEIQVSSLILEIPRYEYLNYRFIQDLFEAVAGNFYLTSVGGRLFDKYNEKVELYLSRNHSLGLIQIKPDLLELDSSLLELESGKLIAEDMYQKTLHIMMLYNSTISFLEKRKKDDLVPIIDKLKQKRLLFQEEAFVVVYNYLLPQDKAPSLEDYRRAFSQTLLYVQDEHQRFISLGRDDRLLFDARLFQAVGITGDLDKISSGISNEIRLALIKYVYIAMVLKEVDSFPADSIKSTFFAQKADLLKTISASHRKITKLDQLDVNEVNDSWEKIKQIDPNNATIKRIDNLYPPPAPSKIL